MEKRKVGRVSGRPMIDYIRHGYRAKSDEQRHKDEKKSEDWFFNPKYKAQKT